MSTAALHDLMWLAIAWVFLNASYGRPHPASAFFLIVTAYSLFEFWRGRR